LWHQGKVLVAMMGGNGVREVDPVSGALGRFVETGEGAHNLFLDAAGGRLFVSNRLGGSLTVLDPETLRFVREYTMPGGPDDIGIDPAGKIWVALRFAEAVAVLDPATGAYESIGVGRSPHGIFLNTELAGGKRVTAEVF
jgi:DNA-binding beta-propeller fold protein YncE